MIEVTMNSDIREIEPKIIGPFTKRQLICVAIAIAYGLPIFFLLHMLPMIARIMISVVLMTPCITCGWCNAYGMPLEKFAMHVVRSAVLNPTKRAYILENSYEELYRELTPVDEAERKKKIVPSADFKPKK